MEKKKASPRTFHFKTHAHSGGKNQAFPPAATPAIKEMGLKLDVAILAVGVGKECISSSSPMWFSLEDSMISQRKHRDTLKYPLSENKIISWPTKSTWEITARENLYF